MARTLILYDGKMSSAQRVAGTLGYLIGNVQVKELAEAPADLLAFDGICFVFNFYGPLTAGKTRDFISKNKNVIQGLRLAFVGVGFSDQGYAKCVNDLEAQSGSKGKAMAMFIPNEEMTADVGAQLEHMFQAPFSPMPKDALMVLIEELIRRHKYMVLATGAGDFVRCTPSKFIYVNSVFYILTKGGMKFRAILKNRRVACVINDLENPDASEQFALQVHGVADIVPSDKEEYAEVMAMAGISEQEVRQLPEEVFVLRITPYKYRLKMESLHEKNYDIFQFATTVFKEQKLTFTEWKKIGEAGEDAAEEEPAEEQPEEAPSLENEEDGAKPSYDPELKELLDGTHEQKVFGYGADEDDGYVEHGSLEEHGIPEHYSFDDENDFDSTGGLDFYDGSITAPQEAARKAAEERERKAKAAEDAAYGKGIDVPFEDEYGGFGDEDDDDAFDDEASSKGTFSELGKRLGKFFKRKDAD